MSDRRGQVLGSSAGVTDPLVTWLWRRAVKLLRPTVALDVGANYGEIGLSARYPRHSRIYLLEPNPAVFTFLSASVASHCNRESIQVVPKAASDVCGFASFGVHPSWSGRSSFLLSDSENGQIKRIEILTTTIDQELAEPAPESFDSLVFKIDVEGHESAVLRGMHMTLRRAQLAVGVIEFDSGYLTKAETSSAQFLDALCEFGIPAAIGPDGTWQPVRQVPEQEYIHTNLLFVTDKRMLRQFDAPWFVRRPRSLGNKTARLLIDSQSARAAGRQQTHG